jgi:hypothetical protein
MTIDGGIPTDVLDADEYTELAGQKAVDGLAI